MGSSIHVSVSPKAAAKLIIAGGIDLTESWDYDSAAAVIHELLSFTVDDLLKITDCNNYGSVAEAKYIPQFGKLDTVVLVPSYFAQGGSKCADYPQLGFFLKKDPSASLGANTKFGENHGKTAALLGLASCTDRRIKPSALSYAFQDIPLTDQMLLLRRLVFRIPIIQILLSAAKDGTVNGYAPMSDLMSSTRHRRGQSIRAIFNELKSIGDENLTARINRVIWTDE